MRELAWIQHPTESAFYVGLGPFFASSQPSSAKAAFFIQDFFLSAKAPFKHPQKLLKITRPEFLVFLSKWYSNAAPFCAEREPLRAAPFFTAFSALQSLIAGGRLIKGVPLAWEVGRYRGAAIDLLRQALQSEAPGRLYGYLEASGEGFMGLSPELLFGVQKNELRTMAVAGTRSLARAAELLVDPKEIEEHEKVVSDILERLGGLKANRTGAPEILKLARLAHLKTDITAEVGNESFSSLVTRLHPTAALGVYPRNGAGTAWLQSYSHDRESFGAPFGFFESSDNYFALVAIRQIQLQADHKWRVGSGCGVLRESQVLREWEELKLKRESVKEYFHV